MTEHYCTEHKTEYFKKGNMKGYAHPIGTTGKWCNEEKKTSPPAVNNGQTASEIFPEEKPKIKEPDYKSPVNRSISLSYAKDLCVGGKIEVKDLLVYADKFLQYMEKGV